MSQVTHKQQQHPLPLMNDEKFCALPNQYAYIQAIFSALMASFYMIYPNKKWPSDVVLLYRIFLSKGY